MRKTTLELLLSALSGVMLAASAPGAVGAAPTPEPDGQPLADLRHGSVSANGVRLHYVVGDGEPVVLEPGWP
ncbi:MAG: hypothetical protein M3461_08085 [Pseudomonadota bacterium]|nr:hypothetical protein [Pseudomonadota bacterium]